MATQDQDRLRTHFRALPDTSQSSGWDALWKNASFLPWDRATPNPALIDLLTLRSRPSTSPDPNPTPGAPSLNSTSLGYASLPPPTRADGTRRRILVPGCGKGYDVALFAAHGYDAYGLEVSAHAAAAARTWLKGAGDGAEGEYKVLDEEGRRKEGGRGKMEVVEGDYFKDEWLSGVEGWSEAEGFDVIYDNTFLCALPLALRPKWAARNAELLRTDTSDELNRPNDGFLVCLEFPTHKPASSAGPPWSLPPTVHAELLKRPGDEIEYDDAGVAVVTSRPEADKALVKIAHYTPRRTHSMGVIDGIVRDCVSIWRVKSAVAEKERWH